MDGLIGIDWGTSSLRATLFAADGGVREARKRPWGIRQLPPGGFDGALTDVCAGWPSAPVLASGMVGSRQGWHEACYVDTPASIDSLAAAIATFRSADGRPISIIPGVRHATGPDVMRGEETQVAGALALSPALAGDSRIVLPGTHSKWVAVRDGKITNFSTMMTGELHALLCRHSILGTNSPGEPARVDLQAFDDGVRVARDAGSAGVLTRIFSARVLLLESRLVPHAIPDYLSGLLIGEEWRAMLASSWLRPDSAPALVGDARLCQLYQRAAMAFDLPQPPTIAGAAARGLWQIHLLHAGHLVDAARVEEPIE